jgi:hypothetical protein
VQDLRELQIDPSDQYFALPLEVSWLSFPTATIPTATTTSIITTIVVITVTVIITAIKHIVTIMPSLVATEGKHF